MYDPKVTACLDNFVQYLRLIYRPWWFSVCRMLVKDDPEHHLQALWGRLAAEILMMTWDTGLKCLQELKDLIDTYVRMYSGLEQATRLRDLWLAEFKR